MSITAKKARVQASIPESEWAKIPADSSLRMAHVSLEELAAAQGVKPDDWKQSVGKWPGDLNDGFEDVVDESRHPEQHLKIVLPTHGLPYAIALDLDGVLWPDEWPAIGAVDMDMVTAVLRVQRLGVQIVFWTCREGDFLDNAIWACQDIGLSPDFVNDNLLQRIRRFGGNPRKVSSDWYIDDRAVSYTRAGTLSWLKALAETIEPDDAMKEIKDDFFKEDADERQQQD